MAVGPLEAGQPEAVLALLDEADALHRSEGDESGLRRSLHIRGQVAFQLGYIERSRKELRESADLSIAAREDFSAASTLHSLGDLELADGRIDEAAEAYEEALRIAWETSAHRLVCYSVAGLASVAAERGWLEPAALLWGFAERYEERLTFTLRRRTLYEERLRPAAEVHRDRWETGRSLDAGAAVTYALSLETGEAQPAT